MAKEFNPDGYLKKFTKTKTKVGRPAGRKITFVRALALEKQDADKIKLIAEQEGLPVATFLRKIIKFVIEKFYGDNNNTPKLN